MFRVSDKFAHIEYAIIKNNKNKQQTTKIIIYHRLCHVLWKTTVSHPVSVNWVIIGSGNGLSSVQCQTIYMN